MSAEKLTVRVIRDDGSVTFKGWYGPRADAAERERSCWEAEGWEAEVVDAAEPTVRSELKQWEKVAVRGDGRFFPPKAVVR